MLFTIKHTARKLRSTIRIGLTLILARTFGTYRHSVTDHEIEYAVYRWRGREWAFPTKPLEN